jgi:hypothetical protein
MAEQRHLQNSYFKQMPLEIRTSTDGKGPQ